MYNVCTVSTLELNIIKKFSYKYIHCFLYSTHNTSVERNNRNDLCLHFHTSAADYTWKR